MSTPEAASQLIRESGRRLASRAAQRGLRRWLPGFSRPAFADAGWPHVVRHASDAAVAYGFVSVILVFFLKEVGLSGGRDRLAVRAHARGDIGVSLCLTTTADRFGGGKTW